MENILNLMNKKLSKLKLRKKIEILQTTTGTKTDCHHMGHMIWPIIWTSYRMDPMLEFWFFKETNLYLYWSCSYILYHRSKTNYKEKPIPGRKTLRLVKAWEKNACNMHPAWRILAFEFESQEPSDRFVPALHDLGMTSLWPLIGHF